MPSLSALREFKASFNNIGGQNASLAANNLPKDLELPDSEPEQPASPNTESPAPDDAAAASATEPEASQEDDIDFSAFLNIPEKQPAADSGSNLDLNSLDNFDLPEEPVPTPSRKIDIDGLDDFDLLNEPLSADSGEPDLSSLDEPVLPAEPPAAVSAESADFGGIDDFALPAEPPVEDSDEPDLSSLDEPVLPVEPPAADSAEPDLSGIDDLALPAEPSAADGDEITDLGDFDDFSLPAEPTAVDSGEITDLGDFDDLGLPDEQAADGSDLDIDGMGDFDFPAEPAADGGEITDLGDFDDLALPAEPAADGDEITDLGDFDDLGLPDDQPADGGDLDIDGMGDFDFPAEPAADGGDLDIDSMGDFNFPEEHSAAGVGDLGQPEDQPAADSKSAGIDDFAPPGKPAKAGNTDDFSFPELDNEIKTSEQKATGDEGAKKAGIFKRLGKKKKVKAEPPPAPDDVEEIQLSDNEIEGIQETLSRYPLNLRIACEEIITEQFVEPKQMADLIEHLVWGASAKETAVLAGSILGKTITVPKAFEKSTGAALEAEQASFSYIFVHNFLPALRIFMLIAIAAASLFYLLYKFVYTPIKAENIYKIGYERIFAGEYQRANERFSEAFAIQRKKNWFYRYAEAFRDERQYIYAEQKYDELLSYYPRDKKGILDYANLETNYLRNYAKADNILRWQLLDHNPNDREGLLAAGDNSLVWGEIDPSKYEDARFYYARLLEKYGWQAPVVERMMMYFIRTDNLREVLPLRDWFTNNPKASLSAESLGELGGYLLDKQLEEVRGVPNEHIEYIGSVRDMLLEAVYANPSLPEPHYHLARYYQSLGNTTEERVTLRVANRAFDDAPEGSIRRLNYRIDAIQRYADALITAREFIPAEEQLVKGINLYEDAVSRRLITRSPKYGKLYAGMGDLEYFAKTGDMEAALRFYHRSEQNGWAPPEMQYRMGSAYYQREDWKNALEYIFAASSSLPLNRRVLFALGNTAVKRGDYFAANGYYNRLLDILESQRSRLPILLPNDRPDYLELAERLMMAHNNAGVACEMLAAQTGNRSYFTRALAFYAEAQRAWDSRTRDPRTMIRSGSTPLPYLNSRNTLYPQENYEPQIFIRIDREAQENSPWEEIAPF